MTPDLLEAAKKFHAEVHGDQPHCYMMFGTPASCRFAQAIAAEEKRREGEKK